MYFCVNDERVFLWNVTAKAVARRDLKDFQVNRVLMDNQDRTGITVNLAFRDISPQYLFIFLETAEFVQVVQEGHQDQLVLKAQQ